MNYMGVADCHGLESFVDSAESFPMTFEMFVLRAAANPQRHAVAYKTDINKKTHNDIMNLMKDEKLKYRFEEALILLKAMATTIYIPDEFEILWDSIPDRTIDPYYSEREL